MTEKVELPPYLLEHTPWEKQINPIWPASSFTLHRNLGNSLFPPKIPESETRQLLDILNSTFAAVKELDKPIFLKAPLISSLDKEYLFEHFLCLEGFQNTLDGQGFIVDTSVQFLGLLNIEDHLQLNLIDSSGEWETSYSRLCQIEMALAQTLNYAFDAKFGFLTSDPGCCGTGLVVRTFLHLPALIHTSQLKEALAKQKEPDVLAFGIEGPLGELIGDILVLSNKYKLGVSEESILSSVHLSTMSLMAAEKTMRTHLAEEDHIDMKDQVSRAYGLLVHSFQLQIKEALGALSLIKLGIDLGWITGITDPQINEIFFKCRRAHLAHLLKEKTLDLQDLGRKRAEFIHTQLKNLHLGI